MSMQIRFEAWLLLLSLLVGCWLMLVYDLLRVLRLMIKHSSFVMGIEDFFYWIRAAKRQMVSSLPLLLQTRVTSLTSICPL